MEAQGLLQVVASTSRLPIPAAYVKVSHAPLPPPQRAHADCVACCKCIPELCRTSPVSTAPHKRLLPAASLVIYSFAPCGSTLLVPSHGPFHALAGRGPCAPLVLLKAT
jgi:hypothetical protein